MRVRQEVLDDLLAHAREAGLRECCGLLIGDREHLACCVRARNIDPTASRYLIAPEDHFAAIRLARRHGLTVVGVYHSHPVSPPVPSVTDLAEADDPELLWVIVGTGVPAVRAFRISGRNFREVSLVPET